MEREVVAEFVVPGEPVSKARARFTNYRSPGRAYTPERTMEGERAVGWAFRSKHTGPADADAAFRVEAEFHCGTRQRRDVDNMLKLVLDALNGVAWADDLQVMQVEAEKFFVDPPSTDKPLTRVRVIRLGEYPRKWVVCAQCEKRFVTYDSWTKRKFCSTECTYAFRRTPRMRDCESCGKPFDARTHGHKRERARWCSTDCYDDRRRVTVSCGHCGSPFEIKAHRQRTRRPACSPECAAALRRVESIDGWTGPTCCDCGGPKSKNKYERCQGCAFLHRAKTQTGPVWGTVKSRRRSTP